MLNRGMKFLRCFWIPKHQSWAVGICLMFVVLPIQWIGILIKSVSILLSSFFLLAIMMGGCSIFWQRQQQLAQQRKAILHEREIEIDLQRTGRWYRLRAMNSSSIIIFDQEYFTEKAARKEIEKWDHDHPCLKKRKRPATTI